MAKRSRSLSKEELDLVDFLVAQVASLSSSLACEVFIVIPPTSPPCGHGCTNCRRQVIDSPGWHTSKADMSEGAASVCSRRSARLAAKHRGGTFELSGSRRRLPSKAVSRRRLPCPRSCSLRFLHGGAFSGLRYVAPPPPSRSGMSGVSLWSA
jgi:hypothetical protein